MVVNTQPPPGQGAGVQTSGSTRLGTLVRLLFNIQICNRNLVLLQAKAKWEEEERKRLAEEERLRQLKLNPPEPEPESEPEPNPEPEPEKKKGAKARRLGSHSSLQRPPSCLLSSWAEH